MSEDEKEKEAEGSFHSGGAVGLDASMANLLERARRRFSRAILNLLDVFTVLNAVDDAPSFAAHLDVLGDLIHAWCELVSASDEDIEQMIRAMVDRVLKARREDAATEAKEVN